MLVQTDEGQPAPAQVRDRLPAEVGASLCAITVLSALWLVQLAVQARVNWCRIGDVDRGWVASLDHLTSWELALQVGGDNVVGVWTEDLGPACRKGVHEVRGKGKFHRSLATSANSSLHVGLKKCYNRSPIRSIVVGEGVGDGLRRTHAKSARCWAPGW